MKYVMGDFTSAVYQQVSNDIFLPMGAADTTPSDKLKNFISDYGLQIVTIGILLIGLSALMEKKKSIR